MERIELFLENKANEDSNFINNLKEKKILNLNKEKIEKKISCDILNNNANKEESKMRSSSQNSKINECSKEESSSPRKKVTIEDFEISYVLGKGSYAKVVLAKNIHTLKIFALKMIDKKFLKREKKENEALIERNILLMMNHPNIISLHSTFQDPKKLYFILEYCPNRDLSDFLKSQGILSFELAQFYAAEIVLALEYIHKKGIYHRDLKPENIILDEKMHLKIVDFATATMTDMVFDKVKKNFVPKPENFSEDLIDDKIDTMKYHIDVDLIGTPEYISPESLIKGESSPSVDFWALGCIIFLFFHGTTPFKDKNSNLIFDKIKNNDFKLNDDLSENTKDIINKLLVIDPLQRLGWGKKENELDIDSLKKHKFFNNIDFSNLQNQHPPMNLKKVVYSKQKNNSTDDLLNQQQNFQQRQSLFNKHISNQNLANRDIKSLKSEMELLYDKNTGDNFEIDKYENNFIYDNAFSIDIHEECVNICHNANNKNKVENTDIPDLIIIQDIVQKKSPWFHYNKRILKLFKSGKIEYSHPTTLKVRGTIILDHFCKGVLVDEKKFDLITKSRKFIFKLSEDKAEEWVNLINEIVNSIKKYS